jgi:hypothetical protein
MLFLVAMKRKKCFKCSVLGTSLITLVWMISLYIEVIMRIVRSIQNVGMMGTRNKKEMERHRVLLIRYWGSFLYPKDSKDPLLQIIIIVVGVTYLP